MRQVLILLVSVIICVSCKSTEYINNTEENTVSKIEYRDRFVHDSIYVRDSIYVHVKGDTIFNYIEKLNTRIVYKTDTIIKTDTLVTTSKVIDVQVKEVNILYWWQKALMYLGLISLAIIVIRLIRK
jgi:PBP1b-binding outer membrane lipoprotein LpoB